MIVVNGRFLTMPSTGVQRYARELVRRLPDHVDEEIILAVPPADLLDARNVERIDRIPVRPTWQGPRGHAWEQAVLPAIFRRATGKRSAASRDGVLFSPANWGPVTIRQQVVLIHDIGPKLHPEFFPRPYRAIADILTPMLVRRCAGLGVSCPTVAEDLERAYGADPARISIIPPGVGGRLAERRKSAPGSRRYCLAVGAHDRRKNIGWLLEWWPEAHRDLGLELIITRRAAASARFDDPLAKVPGVTVRLDPSDDELAALYEDALCLLWPSLYEGFGLPLLEAMALGTPFLASDTGAAAQLAVDAGQVLPLVADRWIDQLRRCRETPQALRDASADVARTWTWDAGAAAAAIALGRAHN